LLFAVALVDLDDPQALQGTDWRLTHLHGTAIRIDDPQTAPSLMLQASPARFSGSGGCDRITGRYQLNGQAITFGPVAGTRMACATGMDIEMAYVQSLADVETWRIVGNALELLDADGDVIARFESRDAK